MFAADTLQTARNTTVPAEVEDAFQIVDAASIDIQDTFRGLPAASESWKGAGGSLFNALGSAFRSLIIRTVYDDNPQESLGIEDAMIELVYQLDVTADGKVDASAVSATFSDIGSPTGSGKLVSTTKRGDGLINENMLAEDISVEVVSDGTPGSESLRFAGESSVSVSSDLWPEGSGTDVTITALDAASSENLISNGTFESESTSASHLPTGWIESVGALGTDILMTPVEVQTVVISGTPTGGYYVLKFTDSGGDAQTTVPLAFGASESDVQTALRALNELGAITVATTGTTPDFTHTVTFTGVRSPAELTSVSTTLTGGTPVITHATTAIGDDDVLVGARSLQIVGDGATLPAIQQRIIGLKDRTNYAVCLWMKLDATDIPLAGIMQVELIDGIGGSVIVDEQATANSFSVTTTAAGDLATATWTAMTGVFRLPRVVNDVVYLRLRFTTAVTSAKKLYIDHVAMVEATELYPGGPFVSVFSGRTPWQNGDKHNLAVANDRAGSIQEYFNRWADMDDKGLLLPIAGAGTLYDDATYIA